MERTRSVWVDRQGGETTLPVEPQAFQRPSLSPDGTRIALEIVAPNGPDDLWVYEVDRGTRTRLTFEASHTDPIWTPDGTRITYSDQARAGDGEFVTWVPVDGRGRSEALFSREGVRTRIPGHRMDGSLLSTSG